MSDTEETNKRGGVLTGLLVFLILAQILWFIILTVAWMELVDRGRSGQGTALAGMAGTVLALVGLVGMWQLRRRGAYVFGLIAAIGLISDLLLGIPMTTLFVRIGLLAWLFSVVLPRWESFH